MRYLLALLAFVLPTAAAALSTATPEQILCNSSFIVLANVVNAKAPDCQASDVGCHPGPEAVYLSIKIKEVLGGAMLRDNAEGALSQEGDIVEIWIGTPYREDGVLADIDVGKEFIFAIDDQVSLHASRRHWSKVYGVAQKEWIQQTLRNRIGSRCPVPQRKAVN